MDAPKCNNCGSELEHKFAKCPSCGLTRVEASFGTGMEALSGVSGAYKAELESLQGVLKIVSIPMENDVFKPEEQMEIIKKIDEFIPKIIESQHLTNHQLESLDAKIEYIKAEFKNQDKKNWYYIFLGILMEMLVQQTLPPDFAITLHDGIMKIIMDVIHASSML